MRLDCLRRRRCKACFTLVELLVVIGLIFLLLGLLLPTLKTAKEAVKASVCHSNLRQDFIAASNYASDYEGYVYLIGQDPLGIYRSWAYELAVTTEYVKPSNIFLCPSEAPWTWNFNSPLWNNIYGEEQVDYADNPLIRVTVTGGTKWYRHTVRVRNPSRYVFIIDTFAPSSKKQFYQAARMPTEGTYGIGMRHRRKANAVFFDGHAGALDIDGMRAYGCHSAYICENGSFAYASF